MNFFCIFFKKCTKLELFSVHWKKTNLVPETNVVSILAGNDSKRVRESRTLYAG